MCVQEPCVYLLSAASVVIRNKDICEIPTIIVWDNKYIYIYISKTVQSNNITITSSSFSGAAARVLVITSKLITNLRVAPEHLTA
jgi:hypothetical protein